MAVILLRCLMPHSLIQVSQQPLHSGIVNFEANRMLNTVPPETSLKDRSSGAQVEEIDTTLQLADRNPFNTLQADGQSPTKSESSFYPASSATPHPCVCRFCNKGFAKASTRVAHERVHTGERPYPCSFCSKSFTMASSRRTHERIHTGERPFACTRCDRRFHQLAHLQFHERNHTGVRPFLCGLCGKTFKLSSHLRRHELTHAKAAASFSC